MPLRSSRRDSGTRFRLEPPGRGIDLRTSAALVAPGTLRACENARTTKRGIEKRLGAAKVSSVAPSNKGIVFGDDAKYGAIPTKPQLILPAGSFALFFSFTADRPASGKTAYLWSNHVSGAAYGVVWATLSDAGVLALSMRTSAGSTITAATAALSNGVTRHGLLVFDAPSGTFTVYLDGERAAQATSIAAGTKPLQTALGWYFGVLWDPGGPGVVADTHFDGTLDGWTLLRLTGQRVADGDPTLLSILLAMSLQQWPNPADPRVVACYDFDEGSGTTAHDRSDYKNDMTLTGAVSWVTGIVCRAAPCNFIGTIERPDTSRDNLWMQGGTLYHENLRGAVT